MPSSLLFSVISWYEFCSYQGDTKDTMRREHGNHIINFVILASYRNNRDALIHEDLITILYQWA